MKHLIKLLAGAVMLPLAAQSAWTLIDDLNDDDFSNWTFTVSGSEAAFFQYPDPVDTSNTGMFVISGENGVAWADAFATIPLPGSVDVLSGQTGTVYWRLLKLGHSNNWHIGLTDMEVPTTWGHYASYMRFSMNQLFEVRNSGSWATHEPAVELDTLNQWYQFWLVLENDGYRLYLQKPGESEPTLLLLNSASGGGAKTAYRRIPEGPIQTLTFMTNSDNPAEPNLGEPWIVDDVWVDLSSENIGVPPNDNIVGGGPTTWGGFTIAGGWVDTGDWFGWLYVEDAPWVYSYSLGSWFYAEEPDAGATGVWAFVINGN